MPDCSINEANANGQKNTIRLSAGTYTLTAVDNTTEGSPSERNGLPSITSTLTLRGAGPDTTIIARAASAPVFRLLHIAASGTVTLEGLTVQGGQCANPSLPHCLGGGGLQNLGTATLTRCTFVNNTALDIDGGGIENQGTMTIHRCTFTDNISLDDRGGGIYNSPSGALLLTDSTLTGNVAAGAGGGIWNGGALVVINSTLVGRSAFAGGGLGNFGGTATFLNTTLADNQGGGIVNERGTMVLLNTLLARNTPGSAGTLDCSGPITSLGV